MNHTPGPWTYDDEYDVLGAGGRFVASCDSKSALENHANARLIASAPELYKALGKCFYVLSMQDRDTDKWKRRRREACELALRTLDAIAKAND